MEDKRDMQNEISKTLIQDIASYGDFWTVREIIRVRLSPGNFGRGNKAAKRASKIGHFTR